MTERRSVGVLGLARSGRAAAELALSVGARVYASDAADSATVQESAAALRGAGARVEVGGHSVEALAACDLLVVSPGIPPTAAVFEDARVRSVPQVSELEYGFMHLSAPVIAVTGTNGKTTTTALVAHLLEEAGFDAPAAGNIGLPLSAVAMRERGPDWAIVEASSFQLAGIESFAPRIGVVTNLAADHLDRYDSLESYYGDKARLFENASAESVWVLNAEEPKVLELVGTAPGRRVVFRVESELEGGEEGGYVNAAGELVVRLDDSADEIVLVGSAELMLLGVHNRANALAASLAALLAGTPIEAVRDGLRSFPALEHRLEPVAERDGVLWVNDSKATNIEATRVALRSMDRSTVVLLGGQHKGEPYTLLADELRERARVVLAFGAAAEEIESDLADVVLVERVEGGLSAVVDRAAVLAEPGDAVLFSPACSSFDMFRDYEERGDRFRTLARGEVDDGS